MINNILEDENYKELVSSQIKETMEYLVELGEEFALTANIDAVNFNPELPSATKEQLAKFSLFILKNYTYTTIKIDETHISFEAGFGSENFGSTVTIPFHAIFQIVVDESILFVNSVATVDKYNEELKKEKSINIFKRNPNNKRFDS
ncbi:hypothetical protein CP965_07880 [Halarcobacter mediterraneus]|uniref:Stringent starvation protein B n=1 Tax=Halarcobacter mediterraneus TaxID=2023153 RepID=A0A4V1M171_9BACT|nr:hypothetical protein [Halarcobacter mediterraneus]RXK12495.1 hypothetical protein CP965_07880 [Halarcobacter mediterraneus]